MKLSLVTAALAILVSFTAFATPPAQPISISIGSWVSIYNLGELSVVDSHFDKAKPLESWIRFKLSGVYEGNICADDSVAIEKTYVSSGQNEPTVYKLGMRALTRKAREIRLSETICTAISKPTPFTTTMFLNLSSWGDQQKSQEWKYLVMNGDRSFKVIHVVFNVETGWKASIENQ